MVKRMTDPAFGEKSRDKVPLTEKKELRYQLPIPYHNNSIQIQLEVQLFQLLR